MIKKFFNRFSKPNKEESVRLHAAGATIRHFSNFSKLESYQNENELSNEFIYKWVNPYYMNLFWDDEEHNNSLVHLFKEISNDIILKNLGDFNWRTRSTGAFYTALKDKREFIDIIGIHLLKSEVCYAGQTYATTLAWFNDEKCVYYLEQYLEYYLKKKNLWFDQYRVLCALKYLDDINGTNRHKKHLKSWNKFIRNKPNWNKNIDSSIIEAEIKYIHKIRKQAELKK